MENDITLQKKCSENSIDRKYRPIPSRKFKKANKKYSRSGNVDYIKVQQVIDDLASGVSLDPKLEDHQLKGNLQNMRECHISFDLLLVYFILEEEKELHLIDLGSHSEIFG